MTDENRESTMTKRESLRDRIIAALSRADQDWCSDNNLYEDMADAVIRELNADLLDFGEWLCEELNSVKISRIDLQSCLDDWRAISPAPQCNSDPEAPHGFDRSASQDEDRYVCECEGWVADD